LEQAGPAPAEPYDLVPVVHDPGDHRLDAGVEPGHAAPAGQDPDPHARGHTKWRRPVYAEGGARTHTPSRATDFESAASASSATSAGGANRRDVAIGTAAAPSAVTHAACVF